MESYRVRVFREGAAFSAAHFIAFDSQECERLHGHNYRVKAEIAGKPGGLGYVYDFVALERMLRSITSILDHRTLLPQKSGLIQVEERGSSVLVAFGRKEWIFPREDCVLLPIGNTTAEELASWIAGRLREEMARSGLEPPESIAIELEENAGQSAIYESSR